MRASAVVRLGSSNSVVAMNLGAIEESEPARAPPKLLHDLVTPERGTEARMHVRPCARTVAHLLTP